LASAFGLYSSASRLCDTSDVRVFTLFRLAIALGAALGYLWSRVASSDVASASAAAVGAPADPAETPQQREDIEHSVYYANCAEARAAGHAPIFAGQPGYRDALDADGDGIACEPYPGD